MVEINSRTNNISLNVSSLGTKAVADILSGQNFYEGIAKQWAISDSIVEGIDYSAKYYANKAKSLVDILKTTANDIKEAKNVAIIEIKNEGDEQVKKLETLTSNFATKSDATYTAGEGISIVNNVISNTRTTAEWGNIEGEIINQTDLNEMLTTQQASITEISSRCYLVSAYTNSTSWYRVYSDGWIEQGGVGTGTGGGSYIAFLKPFSSSNYVLHCQNHQNTTTAWSNRFGFSKTTAGFTTVNDNGIPFDWMACGW